MRNITYFIGDKRLIVPARAFGPGRELSMRMAVDTGVETTCVSPDVVNALGYSVRDGLRIIRALSSCGEEEGYQQRISKLSVLGFSALNFPIDVSDLPKRRGVEGLLGLDFLHHLNYEVRSQDSLILTEKAAA